MNNAAQLTFTFTLDFFSPRFASYPFLPVVLYVSQPCYFHKGDHDLNLHLPVFYWNVVVKMVL